jgi:predicted transposase YdaD
MGLIELIAEQKRQEGMQQGMQEGKRAFISYLIRNSNLCVADIAKEVGVTRAFVQKVRKGLLAAA